jgi:hypothetical protein
LLAGPNLQVGTSYAFSFQTATLENSGSPVAGPNRVIVTWTPHRSATTDTQYFSVADYNSEIGLDWQQREFSFTPNSAAGRLSIQVSAFLPDVPRGSAGPLQPHSSVVRVGIDGVMLRAIPEPGPAGSLAVTWLAVGLLSRRRKKS